MRVLVVDDNVQHVITTRLLLQHAGFEVSIALRGGEVFAEVGRFKPDALLLDIGLPELTGYDIARDLRIAHPDLLIIALTAYGTQVDKMLARMAKAIRIRKGIGTPIQLTSSRSVLAPVKRLTLYECQLPSEIHLRNGTGTENVVPVAR